ncbi:MAG: hypothetical protein K9I68_08445 [Bacteroidales bacterium]|nr:hypothetical protein [Bacteroidales bacterium]MCF8338048.1 hypothetical protein [Bacteroidales bacterium]
MKKILLIVSLSIFCLGYAFSQSDTTTAKRGTPGERTTSSDCTDCEEVITIKGSSAIGKYTEATGRFSFASGLSSKALGDFSSALGYNSTASGLGSFTLGNYNNVTGDYSFSLGSYCNVAGPGNGVAIGLHAKSSSMNSYSFGSFVEAYAPGAMVIGMGASNTDLLKNTKQESLVVGFNSIHPTLFVGMSPTMHQTGKIGIGTDEPATKLHMYSGVDEDAILFLQPKNYTTSDDYAAIFLGNEQNRIKTTHNAPMEFLAESKFVFKGSDVEVGTAGSGLNLKVFGQTATEAFKMTDGAQSNYILTSDAEGNASWAAPSQLDDDDWTVSGTNVYKSDGYVGIGHSNPEYSLDVSGQVRLSSLATTGDEPKLLLINQNGLLENADIPENHIFSENIRMQGNYITHDGDDEGIYVAENGNVGIGEVNDMPGDYRLYVEGGILTEKVRVKLQGEWADYVFDKDYDLMSLSEVESFIKENKHLPDVPSAKEVKKEGMDVAEMNALLLKKVEELTLHIIELEKKVNELQNKQK